MGFIISTYNLPTNSHKLTSTTGGTNQRAFTYDALENLTNDGKYTNTYLNNGRLRTVVWTVGTTTNTITYDLNALGQRVSKTAPSSVGGTRRFMYDEAGRLTGEYDSAGKLVQETIWLGDTPIATLRPKSGSTTTPIAIDIFYIHADHLGTPRAITRPTDNKVVWGWENTEAFGNNVPNENPSALGTFTYNLRLPGQQWDKETNTNYNYFRDYDPSTGRYIESDPIGLKGGINTYAYVKGSPLRWTDPRGLEICEPCTCKGGTWDQELGDFNANLALGFFVGGGKQNLVCRSNKRLKCKTSQICIGGGAIVGGGVGWNVAGTVYGTESCSGLGNSWSDTQLSFNFGPFGFQTPIGDPGGNASVGAGYKGGVAAITCYTIIWGCEQK